MQNGSGSITRRHRSPAGKSADVAVPMLLSPQRLRHPLEQRRPSWMSTSPRPERLLVHTRRGAGIHYDFILVRTGRDRRLSRRGCACSHAALGLLGNRANITRPRNGCRSCAHLSPMAFRISMPFAGSTGARANGLLPLRPRTFSRPRSDDADLAAMHVHMPVSGCGRVSTSYCGNEQALDKVVACSRPRSRMSDPTGTVRSARARRLLEFDPAELRRAGLRRVVARRVRTRARRQLGRTCAAPDRRGTRRRSVQLMTPCYTSESMTDAPRHARQARRHPHALGLCRATAQRGHYGDGTLFRAALNFSMRPA